MLAQSIHKRLFAEEYHYKDSKEFRIFTHYTEADLIIDIIELDSSDLFFLNYLFYSNCNEFFVFNDDPFNEIFEKSSIEIVNESYYLLKYFNFVLESIFWKKQLFAIRKAISLFKQTEGIKLNYYQFNLTQSSFGSKGVFYTISF